MVNVRILFEIYMPPKRSLFVLAIVASTVVAALVIRVRAQAAPALEPQALSASAAKRAQPHLAPTFVELGSDRCVSCRDMIPVLASLRKTHGCHLNVKFIDVWDKPEEGKRFNVRVIPTQVLLDPNGEEIARHTGFWSAASIQDAFASKGFTLSQDLERCAP